MHPYLEEGRSSYCSLVVMPRVSFGSRPGSIPRYAVHATSGLANRTGVQAYCSMEIIQPSIRSTALAMVLVLHTATCSPTPTPTPTTPTPTSPTPTSTPTGSPPQYPTDRTNCFGCFRPQGTACMDLMGQCTK